MIIWVEEMSGRIREFNFEPQSYGKSSNAAVVGTTVDLRFDLLEETGELRADIFWFSTKESKQTRRLEDEQMDIQVASRHLGSSVLILSRDELCDAKAISVQLGGTRQVLRWVNAEKGWVVDLKATNDELNSLNYMKVGSGLAAALLEKDPTLPLEDLSHRTGWPERALAEMLGLPGEASRPESEEEAGWDDGWGLYDEALEAAEIMEDGE